MKMRDKFVEEFGEPKSRQTIDLGDRVICDGCNEEWTDDYDKEKQGAFLFGSKAICPDCAPKWLERIGRFDEARYIKDRQNPGETFAQACRRWRGGRPGTVTVETW